MMRRDRDIEHVHSTLQCYNVIVRLDLIWDGVELVYDTGILVKKEEEEWQH